MPHSWIRNYQLFLFDFDGLLVNTEELHFAAYVVMCKRRGCALKWTLERFFAAAHFDANGLKNAIYAEFPKLLAEEPRWEVLYAEKKQAYMELLQAGQLSLMPGVASLLKELHRKKVKQCVVTNSTKEQIESIKQLLPELTSIPHWLTREQYTNPKPDPECYQKAITEYAAPHDRVIGFEDSLRGFQALVGAGVKGVLIAPLSHPQMSSLPKNTVHFSSFEEIPKEGP
ncbi:MAG: HAD family hydrolase [Chlamydiales bacterium]